MPRLKKLGRCIKTFDINAQLHPLVAGFVHSEETFDVGIRARVADFDLAISLEQIDFVLFGPNKGWRVSAAEVDIVEFEGRTISCGLLDEQSMDSEGSVPDFQEMPQGGNSGQESKMSSGDDWSFEGASAVKESERLIPFLWTPRIIYFRQDHQAKLNETDYDLAIRKDTHSIQAQLFAERLAQLDQEIEDDNDRIKSLEDRMAVFFDDRLRKVSGP
jgi:hypothetical protein